MYPVMLGVASANRHQRKLAFERVHHVRGDAREAVEEPNRAERCAQEIAANGKSSRQQRRDKKLQNGTAPHPERLSQPAKQQMPAFVNWQMNIVEQCQLGKMGC